MDVEAKDKPQITKSDLVGTLALALCFVITMGLAVATAPTFSDAGLQAFEDPEDSTNSLAYIGLLLVFTAFLLYAAKRKWNKVIQGVILFAIGSTVFYVLPPLLILVGLSGPMAVAAGVLAGLASAVLLVKFPEWYVIDTIGILVAAGAASIMGISLGVTPVLLLLVGLAIYDAIAVYRTKHMLSLADSVMGLKLPVLLVIPKTLRYSFLDQEDDAFRNASEENKEDRDAFFMGLGDLVMPTILVVSAKVFGADWGIAPVWGAAIGTLVGFFALMHFVVRGNPQAGLPLLNGGAIVGFFVGLFYATGTLAYWSL